MFESFKGDKKKCLERLEENENLLKERNKRFYYTLNPNLILDYLSNQANFLYSCQGLKNYYVKGYADEDYTLQVASIAFIASIAENRLWDIHYDYFDVGFFIDHIIEKTYGGDIRSHHIDVTRETIHEQIYTQEYGEMPLTKAIKIFLTKIQPLSTNNSWNSILDEYCVRQLEQFDSFLKEYSKKIIDISESLEDSEHQEFLERESNYIDTTHQDLKFTPQIFPLRIVSRFNDITDEHISKRLGIDIEQIDLDYYRDNLNTFFNSPFTDDPSIAIFRFKVDRAYNPASTGYGQSELRLKTETKTIKGVEVSSILNEIIRDSSIKSHIQYLL